MHDRGAGRLGTRDHPAPPSWTVAAEAARRGWVGSELWSYIPPHALFVTLLSPTPGSWVVSCS